MTEFFTVLKLSRDDFAARNWDARELTDDEIREQALFDFEDHLAHFREWTA